MDPLAIKFGQLIVAELLGVGLVIAGIVLAFLALAGKSHLLVELPGGFKAKLTNASPGAVLAIIGLLIIGLSLQSKVERTEETTEVMPTPQAGEQPAQTIATPITKRTTHTTAAQNPKKQLR